jgi:acyl CoA:acetate/3-ketoacid CoA transferase alpha subunit
LTVARRERTRVQGDKAGEGDASGTKWAKLMIGGFVASRSPDCLFNVLVVRGARGLTVNAF